MVFKHAGGNTCMAFTADGTTLVTAGGGSAVRLWDVAGLKERTGVGASGRPLCLAFAPDGKTVFTANGPSNDVSIIDTESKQVTKKIPVGRGPWGIAFVAQPAAAK